jgi:hypothetical protein
MQQLILKKDIPPVKMDALINFLKVWDIDVEVKKYKLPAVEMDEITLLSQDALAQDWSTTEEDKAWQSL